MRFFSTSALTPLGEWLIHDLHGVSPRVTDQARLALALLAFYPTIDLTVSLSWIVCSVSNYYLWSQHVAAVQQEA